MFVVIYSFQVKPGRTKEFEKAWKDLTQIIYQHEGSLGSRLHKQTKGEYIAYAQWPNKKHWESMGDHLPTKSNRISQMMKDSCEEIKTLYQLNVINDLLKEKPHSS